MAEKQTHEADGAEPEDSRLDEGAQAPEAAAPSVDQGEPTAVVGSDDAADSPAPPEPAAVEEPAAAGEAAVVPEDLPPADASMVTVPDEAPPAAGAQEAEAAVPGTETVEAAVAETPQPEVDASTPAVPAAEPAEEDSAKSAGAEEPADDASGEPAGEQPPDEAAVAGDEPVTEEPEPVPAPDAVEEPAPEPAAQPGRAAAAAAPQQQSGPKPKRKRLPRPLRRQRPRSTRAGSAATATRKPIVRLPKPEHERGRRNELQGTVVSAAMDKTIVVKVDTIKAHRRYQKVVRRSTKFHAHDESNQAKPGDVVRIVETRPLSKTKNWRLAEIVEAAK